MYAYNHQKFLLLLNPLMEQAIPSDGLKWLNEVAPSEADFIDTKKLYTAFTMMPRKTGKSSLILTKEQQHALAEVRVNFRFKKWSADQLGRIYLLLKLSSIDANAYMAAIETLFMNAEINEQVALYSALPVLAYPDQWRARCAEGLRSNIGSVLEAIMCNNPYPSEYLDEAAWNQLVLKAIFTEKPLNEIIGFRSRANPKLSHALCGYASERWAAHRQVTPYVWCCVADHVDDVVVPILRRLAVSDNVVEQQAAALVCRESQQPKAKQLLSESITLQRLLEHDLSWPLLYQRSSLNLNDN